MAKASTTLVFPVSAEQYMSAVLDYESYPKFLSGCNGAKIIKKTGKKTKVKYDVSMIKEISYVLEHVEAVDAGKMTWSLVESDFVVQNDGEWNITSKGADSCEVSYAIDIDFKIPVPGLILSGLVKSSLPKMMKEFAEQAKKKSKTAKKK